MPLTPHEQDLLAVANDKLGECEEMVEATTQILERILELLGGPPPPDQRNPRAKDRPALRLVA
jgi:hypothetical protein